MGLSGLVGAGAAQGLEKILAEQLERALFAEQQRRAQAQEALQSRGLDQSAARDARGAQEFDTTMGFQRERAAAADARANEDLQQRGIDAMHRRQGEDRTRLTGLQDEEDERSAFAEMGAAASDEALPAPLRRVLGLTARTRGLVKPEALGPADAMTADERAAEEQRQFNQEARLAGIRASASRPRIDLRTVQSRGPNGEPGNKIITYVDGVPMREQWEPANPSATERQGFGDFTTLKDAFQGVREAYQERLVGPVAGRAGVVRRQLPGVSTPQGFADLESKLAQVQNSLLYLRSGKAINEAEFSRMMKELPSVTDKPDVFQTKLANAETLLDATVQNRKASAGVPASTPTRIRMDRNGNPLKD